jgi:Lon protease-like protein
LPLLPLFPLDVVLLPGTPLPLHIFEPRYKEMIGECLATGAPFGVVRASEKSIADIGCTAEIVTVTKQYAEVLFIPDDAGIPSQEDSAQAVRLHREILTLAGAVQDLSAADPAELSFHLAGSLPLDLDFKQKLLGMRSEGERLVALAIYFKGILPGLRRAARAKEKTGGNGHVH